MYISIKSNEPPPLIEEGKNLKIQFGDSAIFIPLRIIELIDGLRWNNKEIVEPKEASPPPAIITNIETGDDWAYVASFPSTNDPSKRWTVYHRMLELYPQGTVYEWKCNCPSYTFSKGKPKTCKHIALAQK